MKTQGQFTWPRQYAHPYRGFRQRQDRQYHTAGWASGPRQEVTRPTYRNAISTRSRPFLGGRPQQGRQNSRTATSNYQQKGKTSQPLWNPTQAIDPDKVSLCHIFSKNAFSPSPFVGGQLKLSYNNWDAYLLLCGHPWKFKKILEVRVAEPFLPAGVHCPPRKICCKPDSWNSVVMVCH